MKVIGQTWQFENKPVIIGTGTIVGPEEGEGPLADDFDYIYDNIEINEKHGKRRNGNCWRMLQEKRLRRRASRKTSRSFCGRGLDEPDHQQFVCREDNWVCLTSAYSVLALHQWRASRWPPCSWIQEGPSMSWPVRQATTVRLRSSFVIRRSTDRRSRRMRNIQ